MVCLDTGHHAPGTNIEFIVMQLLRLGKLGSFDFNSRFYADDDLIVGAWRETRGLPGNPITAYTASGYQAHITTDRVGGQQASWGA